MFAKWTFCCTILWIHKCSSQGFPGIGWPRAKNVEACRSTPIDINTAAARPTPTTPLIVIEGFVEKATVVNTGNAVEVRVDQPTAAQITGGVLYNETYVYYGQRYYWTCNRTGIAEHSINGKGSPLAVEIYLYKKTYTNFNDSLNYSDGLVIISILISVGPISNPLFDTFKTELQRITVAGSHISVNVGSTFNWYFTLSAARKYYAYPGSYTDISTGIIYNCATVIVLPFSTAAPFISTQQFLTSFGLLKNSAGAPLTNVVRRHHSDGRPIACAKGLINLSVNY